MTGYQYRQSSDGGATYGAWTDIPYSGFETDSHTVTGLTASTQYSFQVRVMYGVQGFAVSGAASVTLAPLAPASITATAAAAGQITLACADAGNKSITHHRYRHRKIGGTWITAATAGSTSPPAATARPTPPVMP